MATWLRISPTLTPEGAFAALSGLPRSSEMKPIPIEPTATPFGTRADDGQEYEFGVGAQLGFASVADISTSFKKKTYVHDLMYYAPSLIPKTPQGGLIYGTLWGAGIRIRVEVKEFNAKGSLNFGTIAAAASLGLAEASFIVEGLGIADISILKLLPGPGRFDAETHKRILDAKKEVEQKFLIPKNNLTPVPYMIWATSDSFSDPIAKSRAQLFAIRRIRDGVEKAKALAAARAANVDVMSVETVYEKWVTMRPGSEVPDDSSKQKARQWLDRARV